MKQSCRWIRISKLANRTSVEVCAIAFETAELQRSPISMELQTLWASASAS